MHMFRSALLRIVLILAFTTIGRAQGQDPSMPDPNYRAPRTADQTPDISGLWRNDTLTPLERPTALGDQAYLSDEEAAAIQTDPQAHQEAEHADREDQDGCEAVREEGAEAMA